VAAALLAALLSSSPAQAQFICGGSVDGNEPQDGDNATVTNNNVACGTFATATGGGSSSFGLLAGNGADPGNMDNTAIGSTALLSVTGSGNTAIGNSAGGLVTGDGNTASGRAAGFNALGDFNAAYGHNAGQWLTGDNNIAMGRSAGSGENVDRLIASDTISIGTNALASADGAIAMGKDAKASGPNAIAFGNGASATGSIAMGTNASAANEGAAFGDFSTATGTNSTAVGPRTTVAYKNAAAFGNGATATRPHQQVFGTSSNTYTMRGITSGRSKSAQGRPSHIVTSNNRGDLAAYTPRQLGLATQADVGVLNTQIRRVDTQIRRVGRKADEATTGVAMAFAMAGVPTLLNGERFAMTGNWGTFEGENGLAMNAALRLSSNVQLNGGVGWGLDEDLAGGRVGVRVGW
jgi:autotransporter adhesin